MNLTKDLATLRGQMPEANAYVMIAAAAIALAQEELLGKLQAKLKGLAVVTVGCDNQGEGVHLDTFKLTLDLDDEVLLFDLNARAFAQSQSTDIDDLAAALGFEDIGDEVPDHVIQAFEEVFGLLHELASLKPLVYGETHFPVASTTEVSAEPAPPSALDDLKQNHPNLTARHTWLMYSKSEAAASDDDAGYWSNEWGWTTNDLALTAFSGERYMARLPSGPDIEWRSLMQVRLAAEAADLVASFGKFNGDLLNDASQYKGVEVRGVVLTEGGCEVNNSDPQFYTVYLRKHDGEAIALTDYLDYKEAFSQAYGLSVAWKKPILGACGDMDYWFDMAVSGALHPEQAKLAA